MPGNGGTVGLVAIRGGERRRRTPRRRASPWWMRASCIAFAGRSRATDSDRAPQRGALRRSPYRSRRPTRIWMSFVKAGDRGSGQGHLGRGSWLAGIDHVAAVLFMRAIDADGSRLVYVPFLTSAEAVGRGRRKPRLGRVPVLRARSAAEVKAGRIRVLGIASTVADRAGSRAPTLARERDRAPPHQLARRSWLDPGLPLGASGVTSSNAGRGPCRLAPLARSACERKGWQDAFLPPEPFALFLASELARVQERPEGNGGRRSADQRRWLLHLCARASASPPGSSPSRILTRAATRT